MTELTDREKNLTKDSEFINIIEMIKRNIDEEIVTLAKSSWVYDEELTNKIVSYSSFNEILQDNINKLQRK